MYPAFFVEVYVLVSVLDDEQVHRPTVITCMWPQFLLTYVLYHSTDQSYLLRTREAILEEHREKSSYSSSAARTTQLCRVRRVHSADTDTSCTYACAHQPDIRLLLVLCNTPDAIVSRLGLWYGYGPQSKSSTP